MLFNDPIFLFAFLPLVLICVWLATRFSDRVMGIIILVAASLFFYGWWKATGVFIIVGSVAGNLMLTRILALREWTDHRRLILALGIAANLSVLGYYKYANFFIKTFTTLGGAYPALDIVLPIGLSFYTFQQIAFLTDSYTGKIGRVTPQEYMASVLLFPHLIAGPLVHYRNIIEQFRSRFYIDGATVLRGLPVFIVGLTKKVFLADNLSTFVSPLYVKAQAGPLEILSAWIAALGYTAQLYFDFSGYSDMAIGLAMMFGIILPVNFLSPYKATSIIEFWRRWHITLSEFLRDYLYFPLGGNRKGSRRRFTNRLLLWLS